jgi:hypothetical protein
MTMAGRQNALSRDHLWLDIGLSLWPEELMRDSTKIEVHPTEADDPDTGRF